MTLIIYDMKGKIWSMMSGNYEVPDGIPYIKVEVPEGKIVTGVDVTVVPRVPIYIDNPMPETVVLRNDIDALYAAVDFLLGI